MSRGLFSLWMGDSSLFDPAPMNPQIFHRREPTLSSSCLKLLSLEEGYGSRDGIACHRSGKRVEEREVKVRS